MGERRTICVSWGGRRVVVVVIIVRARGGGSCCHVVGTSVSLSVFLHWRLLSVVVMQGKMGKCSASINHDIIGDVIMMRLCCFMTDSIRSISRFSRTRITPTINNVSVDALDDSNSNASKGTFVRW